MHGNLILDELPRECKGTKNPSSLEFPEPPSAASGLGLVLLPWHGEGSSRSLPSLAFWWNFTGFDCASELFGRPRNRRLASGKAPLYAQRHSSLSIDVGWQGLLRFFACLCFFFCLSSFLFFSPSVSLSLSLSLPVFLSSFLSQAALRPQTARTKFRMQRVSGASEAMLRGAPLRDSVGWY